MAQLGASPKIFTSHRVIYGDTDQMGVVYYANYLRWFEKGGQNFCAKSVFLIRQSRRKDFISL